VREARTPGFFLNFFSEFGEKEHYRIIFIYSWDNDHDGITFYGVFLTRSFSPFAQNVCAKRALSAFF
jgi:hypothetical protein